MIKYRLIIFCISIISSSVSFAGNSLEDNPYKEFATEVCNCVNTSTRNLSARMINIIIDSDGDQTKFENEFALYLEEDQEAAFNDADLLQGEMMTKLTSCLERITREYDVIFKSEDEKEVDEKVLQELQSMDGCERSAVFYKFGLSETEDENPVENSIPESDLVYYELGEEMCNCMNVAVSSLSDDMKDILIASNGDIERLQAGIEEYAERDPVACEEDGKLLESAVSNDFQNCIDRLTKKYEDVYENESNDEVVRKLLEVFEGLEQCAIVLAFYKLGM